MSNNLKSCIQTLMLLEDKEDDDLLTLMALLLQKRRKQRTSEASSSGNEIKVFCPKCNTEVSHTAAGIQEVENDMENYVKYKLVGGLLKLKRNVVPHKFLCQEPGNGLKPRTHITGLKRRNRKYKRIYKVVHDDLPTTSDENIEEIIVVHSTPQIAVNKETPKKIEVKKIETHDRSTMTDEKFLIKDQTKILIAKVYHYFEQEYEKLKKINGDLDLTPLSNFCQRTALATGVSETALQQILKEEEGRNPEKRREPPKKRRAARKRRRQTDSSSKEDTSDENDDNSKQPRHDVETFLVKIEPCEFNNEEPGNTELILPVDVKIEEHSDGENENKEPEMLIPPVKVEPSDDDSNKAQTDPISVEVKIEPDDTVNTDELGNTELILPVDVKIEEHSDGENEKETKTIVTSCVQSPKEYGKRKRQSANKIPKTNAQRQQKFRQNQKNIQKSETLNSNLARRKNDAERSKRYRDRIKLRKQRGELDSVLPKPSKEHREQVKTMVKPKRPMSAYFLWLSASREKIKSENPGLKVTELARKGGQIWKALDKSVWEEKAAKAKKQYEKDLEAYYAHLGGGSIRRGRKIEQSAYEDEDYGSD